MSDVGLFKRSEKNPILSPKMLNQAGIAANAVFNAGVTKFKGKYFLLLRVEGPEGFSYLLGADSENGVDEWRFRERVVFAPQFSSEWGFEDPRITYLSDIGHWAITYVCYGPEGAWVKLALTKNFYFHQSYTFFGNILPPNNKDAALFPRPIKGKWCMLHRPMGNTRDIWISWTRDNELESLGYWGRHRVAIVTDGTPRWDGRHIGINTPPLETEKGWLICYHAAKPTSSGPIYRLGLALLDLNDPTKVLYRTRRPVMSPVQPYEMIGEVDKVIFPCGWLVDDEGILRLYYGAADKYLCLAQASLEEVLAFVIKKENKIF